MKPKLNQLALVLIILCCLIIPIRAKDPAAKGSAEAGSAVNADALHEIDSTVRNKIDPELLKQFLEVEETAGSAGRDQVWRPPATLETPESTPITYLVFLRDRADLRTLQAIPDKETRRAALVDRLQNVARHNQAGLLDHLQERAAQGNVVRYKSYWIFNGLVVESDLETALELARRPEVEAIRPNRIHRLPEPQQDADATLDAEEVAWNVTHIQADRVWNTFDITGQGVVVANMDSGVDWTHPALQHRYRGYDAEDPAASVHDYNWVDYTENSPIPNDSIGHGTHTMGTMVGSTDSYTVGVAPGAQWIAAKVFDDGGEATDEWIHAGFQWCLAPTDLDGENPDPSRAPDIVNNSWGDPDNVSDETFRQDLEAWRAAGILSVWSAGNSGPDEGTINSPAGLEAAFAVGAVDANDDVASFSSRGPSPWVEIKPDVVAPGVSVPSSVPGGTYESWKGTSMATPHAAGLAALLWEAAGASYSITNTEQTIITTTVDLGTAGPDTTYGYGRIDAYEAVATAIREKNSFFMPIILKHAALQPEPFDYIVLMPLVYK